MKILEYKIWDKFINVIKGAKISCKQSDNLINDHFVDVAKMLEIGSNTKRKILDYKLSRYICYLIAQNGDSRKKIRDTISKLGGTMPEDLPTPEKSLKEIEKEIKHQLVNNK